MKLQKGFTIIELIVVIAIIAILAAIVMVSVVQYINKSKDATIKATMSQLPMVATQAIVRCPAGYGQCGGSPDDPLYSFVDSLENILPPGSVGTDTAEGNTAITADAWCVWATLYSKDSGGNTAYWCVDSTGYMGTFDGSGAGVYSCGADHPTSCQ